MRALIFLFLLPGVAMAAPGLVRVHARVSDEGAGKLVDREGTGTIVRRGTRYFVLTAAHVSVGADPELESDGEKLTVLKRAADAIHDVDWFEVRPPERAKALVVWDQDRNIFMIDPAFQPSDSMTVMVSDCRWLNPRSNTGAPCQLTLYSPPAIVASSQGGDLPEIYLSGKDTFARALIGAVPEAVTGRIVLPKQLKHGESGSPLFRKVTDDGSTPYWRLVGIAQSFDINFPFAYYGTTLSPSLSELMNLSLHTKANGPFWRLRYGVTYLDFGDGIKEIAIARSQASGGLTDNGGIGGLTDDGGIGGLTDDGSSSGNAGTSSGDVFAARKLEPGIEVDGKSCVGFRAGKAGAYFADRSVVEALHQGSLKREGCIATGAELLPLFNERITASTKKPVRSGTYYGAKQTVRVTALSDGINVRLALRDGNGGQNGILGFRLDAHGGYEGQPFRPVIRLKSPVNNRVWVVDLRGLFFSQIGWGGKTDFDDATYVPMRIVVAPVNPESGLDAIREYVVDTSKEINSGD